MTLYRIRDWDVHFENSKSREREKCSFCCVPNKQDGLGYGMLMREQDGESLYGAFVAVVLVASKQKKRKGYLTADGLPSGCPLSARQLSIKSQFKEATIQRMFEVVSSNEIGWIDKIEKEVPAVCPLGAHEPPDDNPADALERKKEEKGIEGREVGAGAETPISKSKGTNDEVKAFCVELQLPASDADWFFFKCQGNGWKNNGNPIKDWKATIRAWKAANYMPSQKNPQSLPQSRPAGVPTLAEVRAYVDEKVPNGEKNPNWATSFHTYWTKLEWKKNGALIDWKIKLSEQISRWRTE